LFSGKIIDASPCLRPHL